MKVTTIEHKCDICKKDVTNSESRFSGDMQVIFTTERNEGRACNPYLADEHLDLCEYCFKNLILGNCIFASGAQGHNSYYFKGIEEEVENWRKEVENTK